MASVVDGNLKETHSVIGSTGKHRCGDGSARRERSKRHHNIVDYTIVPNPQAVSMIGTHQLLAAGRSGFRLQGFYGRHNLGNPHPVDPAKFFGGRPGDLNAVKDHRRSVVL